MCAHCETKEVSVKDLSVRKWECKNCGCMNDRDLNASINIMYKGIEMYLKEQYNF